MVVSLPPPPSQSYIRSGGFDQIDVMVTVYQYIVYCTDLLCKINTKKHPPPKKKITTTKKTKHSTLMIHSNTCTVPYKKYLELYLHLKNPLIGCRHSISG